MKKALTPQEYNLVNEHGKLFNAAPLPADIIPGRLGFCFDDCIMRAINSDGKYQYVEGIASDPENQRWILHAWLTDGINAFDPTWGYQDPKTGKAIHTLPMPSAYIGIAMPTDKVVAFMRKTTYQGVIANRHRAPLLAKELIGGL